ncbi:peroxiredoxin [Agaricicola taiwanensis]|uniref:Peroxiredoxin n=1 Tax=Agaricicola taiwanensis TaxID=591372 RepID=A0A8J2YLI9_9RHOB|nr:OsmC family protein [Agaricicola taiwanensis]GGE50826.1 peroxiredoxin [Agaricicola taiwanensis]
MARKATAVWTGSGKEGSGKLSGESKAFTDLNYSATTRFGEGVTGTNPEELIAAAHAGCFSMALAFALGEAGYTPDELRAEGAVTVVKQDSGFTITKSQLTLNAKVPGISEDEFLKIAEGAKKNCPVSKVLNAEITLDARLNA